MFIYFVSISCLYLYFKLGRCFSELSLYYIALRSTWYISCLLVSFRRGDQEAIFYANLSGKALRLGAIPENEKNWSIKNPSQKYTELFLLRSLQVLPFRADFAI